MVIVGLLISYYPSYQSYTYKIAGDVNKTKFQDQNQDQNNKTKTKTKTAACKT